MILLLGDEEDFESLKARIEYFKLNPQEEDYLTQDNLNYYLIVKS